MLEQFPTRLIIKTLPKIDRKRPYFREAVKFIEREKVCYQFHVCYLMQTDYVDFRVQISWPRVKSEIILLNYLFNPKYQVKENEALLIIVLLLDLQQDFRLAIKRSTVRFLLR